MAVHHDRCTQTGIDAGLVARMVAGSDSGSEYRLLLQVLLQVLSRSESPRDPKESFRSRHHREEQREYREAIAIGGRRVLAMDCPAAEPTSVCIPSAIAAKVMRAGEFIQAVLELSLVVCRWHRAHRS